MLRNLLTGARAYVESFDDHYLPKTPGFYNSLYSSHAAYPYDYNHYSPSAYTDLEVGSRHLANERKFLSSRVFSEDEFDPSIFS